jgi:hypothetical protein
VTVLLSEPAKALLRAVLAERDALVDRATDRVFLGSPDLAGKRPRIVTHMLIDRVFACSEAALLQGDDAELGLFIDQVTGIRAERGFHVSTLFLGFRSFRFAVEEPIRRLADDPWVAWELLTAADDVFAASAARAADLLVERQTAALESRKAFVERENARLGTEVRADREALATLRADLDAAAVSVLRLEQELDEKNLAIRALTDCDQEAREILEHTVPGPERTAALREILALASASRGAGPGRM